MFQKFIGGLALCLAVSISAASTSTPLVRVVIHRDVPTLDKMLKLLLQSEYEGTMSVVKAKDGSYYAVNTLDVETYLLSVVACEMSSSAPVEALKAQAISARSHAIYLTTISEDEPYDLVANLSQAYNGKHKLHKNIVLAIESTRGQLLRYGNKLIPAYFHASCGGHTETVCGVWGSEDGNSKLPITASCPYCTKTKENKWTLELSVATLQRMLKSAGYEIGSSPFIRTVEKGNSGRALNLEIDTGTEKIQILAEKFRSLIGYNQLRSTLFEVSRPANADGTPGDTFLFQGDGFGHGVGLCQYGAQEMAERGASHEKILAHYFPDSQITSITPEELASRKD
jgi:stage II sporulation protein D